MRKSITPWVGVILFTVLVTGCVKAEEGEVNVRSTADGIVFTSTHNRTDCRAKMNTGGSLFRDGWVADDFAIYKEAEITVPYGHFTKKGGERFDVGTTMAEDLALSCSKGYIGYYSW